MSCCNDRVPVWRVMILFIACLSIYLYLYTNVFGGIKTASLFRVIQSQAVFHDKAGSISSYLKLMKESDHLQLGTSSINTSKSGTESTSTSSVNPTTGIHPTAEIPANMLMDSLKMKILNNQTEPLLTLFTTWTLNAEKFLVHNLTLINWISLRPFVVPVLFTNDTSVGEEASKSGWHVFSVSKSAAEGIPVLKYMYKDVMESFNTTFYAYSNGDILFTDSLIKTLTSIKNSGVDLANPVLIVGQRTNVNNVTLEEGSYWENITAIAKSRGSLFTGYAEDFFITSGAYPWRDSAEVVIGRRAYDNWLVFNARKLKHTVIDATGTLLAVHQTTKSGNFEGHGHKNGEYNHNLLVKLYKGIRYGAGVIGCCEKFTKYENDTFKIANRNVPKSCAV